MGAHAVGAIRVQIYPNQLVLGAHTVSDSNVGGLTFNPWSSQTKDLQNWDLSLPCLVLGITKIMSVQFTARTKI